MRNYNLKGGFEITTYDECRKGNTKKYKIVEFYRNLIIAFLNNTNKVTFKEIIENLGENYKSEDVNIVRVNVLRDSKYFRRERNGKTTYYSLS